LLDMTHDEVVQICSGESWFTNESQQPFTQFLQQLKANGSCATETLPSKRPDGSLLYMLTDHYGIIVFTKTSEQYYSNQPSRSSVKWKEGDEYEGEIQNNKRHGIGTMNFGSNSSSSFHGEWIDDKINGKGLFTFDVGIKYEGYWKDGNPHGRGVYTYANGDNYDGEFKNGVKNGKGLYTFSNGNKKEGYWKEGHLM